ncbi:RING finger protein nenya-like [Daphnia carinata]|uniref:RING finger protein nenya-like n=1 Tax=Daphnia carinata TaxID=120202 RepID=UPI00257C52A7|nr:RING finger protein nenya-like [Daphnia carinata]
MDWIHCNDCFKQPYSSPNTLFVLTSCARIQCSDCNSSKSCINRDCKPCKSQNYNAVPLDESIPSAVEDFFRDPLDHLKRFLKVYDFQRNHRDQLLKRQTEQQKQVAAQTTQWQRTTTDLQSQVQKYRSEVQDTKEENMTLKLKIQELENMLAKERRSVAPDLYQYSRNHQADPKKRSAPTPSTGDRASDDRNMISWQQKVPGVPTNPPDRPGPIRQRYVPTQQHQPYKSRVPHQFLNVETPAYFPSYSSTPAAVARPSVTAATPKNALSSFPTPIVHRPRQYVMAPPMPTQVPKQHISDSAQLHSAQQRKRAGSYNNRVYAFMSEAARQALTPEPLQAKKL